MKTKIIEKNGFPKPLGLFLIIIILSLTCFINLAFADGLSSSDPDLISDEKIDDVTEPVDMDAMTAFPIKIGL